MLQHPHTKGDQVENFQRRPSGIYVTRLTVPIHLRKVVGRREFIGSTGTQFLTVAKLVATTTLSKWRRQLMDLERIALVNSPMKHDSVIKLTEGHPLLATDSYLPLEQAVAILGLEAADVLRSASELRTESFIDSQEPTAI